MKRNPALDGIRAFAILAVIAFHLRLPGFAAGQIGVNVFFVLSGFLITSILLREVDSTGAVRLRRFFARRALRLLPALFTMIAVVVVYTLAVRPAATHAPLLRAVPWVVFYAGNWERIAHGTDSLGWFGHTWSLSIEEQFYLLWPLVLIALAKWRGVRAVFIGAAVGSAASLAIRATLWHGHGQYVRIYNGTDTVADQLLIGCILACAFALKPQALHAASRMLVWPAIVVLIIMEIFQGPDGLRYTAGYTLIALAGAIVIGRVVTEPHSNITRVLAWRPLATIGLISYGLYIWHLPILLGVEGHIQSKAVLTIVVLALSFTAAGVSWRLVEAPALRLKRRFESSHALPVAETATPSVIMADT